MVKQFSVWITRNQGTQTNAIAQPLRPCGWSRAKTNAADSGIAPPYKHLLCVHQQGDDRAWAQVLVEIIGALEKCYCETPDKEKVREFLSCARIRSHDCFRTAKWQYRKRFYLIRFHIFPNKVVHIVAVTPTTERSFSVLRRLKLTSAAPWSNKVSVTASHLLTFKGHMPTL